MIDIVPVNDIINTINIINIININISLFVWIRDITRMHWYESRSALNYSIYQRHTGVDNFDFTKLKNYDERCRMMRDAPWFTVFTLLIVNCIHFLFQKIIILHFKLGGSGEDRSTHKKMALQDFSFSLTTSTANCKKKWQAQ